MNKNVFSFDRKTSTAELNVEFICLQRTAALMKLSQDLRFQTRSPDGAASNTLYTGFKNRRHC